MRGSDKGLQALGSDAYSFTIQAVSFAPLVWCCGAESACTNRLYRLESNIESILIVYSAKKGFSRQFAIGSDMGKETCFTEQRKFTRIPFNTEIRITSGNRTLISNALKDISLGGAFIFSNESFPESTTCCMDISLIGPASLLKIQIEAEIVRVDENGMAVEFTKIDLDGLVHLHHFIKVHSQNPEDIEQEFKSNLLEVE